MPERRSSQFPKPRKAIRRRPVQEWKLIDSLMFIKARREYLEKEGILVRTGKKNWTMRF
jgi:hypothetical protein